MINSFQLLGGEEEKITLDLIKTTLKRFASSAENLDDILSEDSEYNFGSQLAQEFVSKIGSNKFPEVRLQYLSC